MTRPRVPDDKRQRTARACDSCKRRKQKCNGLHPCNTCIKRNLICDYTDGRGPAKLMAVHTTSPTQFSNASDSVDAVGATPAREATIEASPKRVSKQTKPARQARRRSQGKEKYSRNAYEASSVSEGDESARQSTPSESDEEIEVIGQIRMLQDHMKRLLYIGDSSTLSYLQLIRMIVFNTTGPSAFTEDSSRHDILEPVTVTSSSSMIPYMLPNRDVSNFLVQSYFVNTNALIDIFDRATFYQYLDACYSTPLEVNSSTLCLVYLTLAIGFVLATPAPNSPEELMMKSFPEGPGERAETLFRAAKCLSDPLNVAEHADLWIIQAWTLMAFYMLVVSKRNAAYAYCGMAVRSAYSLGLHRIRETMVKFKDEAVRRNMWRSLFVLDRFLATALGRPAAIYEEDCSSDSLDSPAGLLFDAAPQEVTRTINLDASVRIFKSIGTTLKKVYSERKISTKLAEDIVDDCQLWAFHGHPSLAAQDLIQGKAPLETGIPILHVQLMHYHSILLLSRPFFIDLLVKTRPRISSDVKPFHRTFTRSEKFSQACVAASTHSVTLIQAAFEAKYLPRRNPFILYFLFAAALIILSNEFAGFYENEHYAESMKSTIKILEYCAVEDVQAQRMLYILKSFLADVENHSKSPLTSEQSELALPECHIGDPEEVLQTRRQSLTARRNHHQQHQQPSTPVGGGDSSDAMEYYSHMETDARQSTAHIQNMGPLVMRGERAMASSATNPTVPRRSNNPRSFYRRADLALVKSDEQEFEEFDQISPVDFQSPMDSEETKIYTHDYNPAMMSHGEQSAFQVHHGGGFRGYPAAGVSPNERREAERAHFGGHYLYADEK
ncbi:fungal-specific transcription factor domain-containing protein [Trichoderma chlorosporum]